MGRPAGVKFEPTANVVTALPLPLHLRLKKAVVEERRTQRDVVVEAIEAWLDRRDRAKK